MEKFNVGIIGTGGMGKAHAHSYMRNENVNIMGVCSKTRELARSFACGEWKQETDYEGLMGASSLYKIEKVFDDYHEMAEDKEIQIVDISIPNSLHFPVALEMLKHKKHVLIEKPLATTLQEAQMLYDTAAKNGVILATGHMWRYHKDVNYVKETISSGELGRIVKTRSYGLHLRWGPGGWFKEKKISGGGALLDMGVHAIDTARYVIGEPETESVYACIGTRFGEYDVDDQVEIITRYKDGTYSVFEAGWNYPHISGKEGSVEIWCTNGYARIFPTFIEIKKNERWIRMEPDVKEEWFNISLYEKEIDDFVNEITGKGKSRISGRVGLEVIKITDAAYRSQEKNEVIFI